MMNELEKIRHIKRVLQESKTKAKEAADQIRDADPLTFEDLDKCITDYILAKYMLEPEECDGVDFQKLSELSLSKTMEISPDLVKEFDTARSCAGATSATAKKTLLYMSIQKELKIELEAEKTPKIHTFEEFSKLVWDAMKNSSYWISKMRDPSIT